VPNRRELLAAGLMPPCMLGDYAIPSCDWHWYYCDNALALQGLRRFAEAMAAVDPDAGRQYRAEADAFERDLRRVIDRETALSPVRPGRDGMYHSFLPRMVYARGQTGPELGAPQFPDCDRWMGALPLAEPLGAIRASDPRMRATLDIMEEMGTSAAAVQEREQARRQKGLLAGDAWFWHGYVSLPKASHNANIYLLQDDVPGFLRFWANAYAAMVGSDGRLWEHWHLGQYTPCENPDNGTAGWFLENFRNLLVMEDGDALWLARATPRAWLEQDRRMTVDRAPTHFGPLAFEIVSDVDQGRITAVIQVPRRTPAARVLVRLRHPRGALMRAVTVNGRPWTRFDAAREFVELAGLSGRVDLAAEYPPSAGKAR
jgi:hypothetical protein